MKTLKWILLTGSIFIFCMANAQAKLGVTIDSFPSQVTLMDTAMQSFTMNIINSGDSAFNDTVNIQYTVNGGLYNGNIYDQGFYFPAQPIALAAGASVQKQLNVNFNLSPFMTIGSSAVVIWPISNHHVAVDTTSYQIQITVQAGLNTASVQNLHVYINQQQLFINTDVPNLLKRVRIFDISGQLLLEQSLSLSAVILMNQYSSAIYFAEVTFSDNTRRVFKIPGIAGR